MKQIITCWLILGITSAYAQTWDLVITNGKILDGTGNGWYKADIGIKNGKITAIGNLADKESVQKTDATGFIVSPGFIDVHAHIEGGEFRNPAATNFLLGGVTTVVTGNCGGSELDLGKYFNRLDSIGMGINVASLIGHNSVRRAIIGDAMRDPSADELKKMEALVSKAMKDGAAGLSTGLIYVPGTFAKTGEIIRLASQAAASGGVYASHIRDEGDYVSEAVNEAISIGKEAGLPVQISHFKVTYKPNHGRSVETLALVEKARKNGLDVTLDQYPYIASSTTLDQTMPSWAFSGGRDSLKWRLDNPAIRSKIKRDMISQLKRKQLNNFSYAVIARFPADSSLNGLNISEVNLKKGRKANMENEAETIMELVAAADRTQMVFFSMSDADLERIMKYPHNMIASDAGIAVVGSGMPHPRAYGTNSRVLGKYVREHNIISLEEAIRRMTSLPARKFGLKDRGMILEGMAADLVVFDDKAITDEATFSQPHRYASGIKYVIVNGEIAAKDGTPTEKRYGKSLRHLSSN
ncbi:MAG: N-acyl-D-amino-acid deacylase family protein [Cyclobacteriaceae bacterium]